MSYPPMGPHVCGSHNPALSRPPFDINTVTGELGPQAERKGKGKGKDGGYGKGKGRAVPTAIKIWPSWHALVSLSAANNGTPFCVNKPQSRFLFSRALVENNVSQGRALCSDVFGWQGYGGPECGTVRKRQVTTA
eukprot:6231648-Amphidinium_carterae.1